MKKHEVTYTKTKYECDACNHMHCESSSIVKCDMCHVEVCYRCYVEVQEKRLICDNNDFLTILENKDINNLCKPCYKELELKIGKYFEDLKKYLNERNET